MVEYYIKNAKNLNCSRNS